jgi:hypothetical protein
MQIAQARLDETDAEEADEFRKTLQLCATLVASKRPGLYQLLSGAVKMLGSTTEPENRIQFLDSTQR